MEDQKNGITDKPALQACLIQQTLASWRFFLLFSFPPFIWGLFIVPLSLSGTGIVFLSGIVWFGCWRLWLDERYFRFISEDNNETAGEILHGIWSREGLLQRSFADRQQGALTLFRHTMRLTGIVWVAWLLAGLWMI